MTNLYWIAYYKSLLVRNLMARNDAVMFIKNLREYEKSRQHPQTALSKIRTRRGSGSAGKVKLIRPAYANVSLQKNC